MRQELEARHNGSLAAFRSVLTAARGAFKLSTLRYARPVPRHMRPLETPVLSKVLPGVSEPCLKRQRKRQVRIGIVRFFTLFDRKLLKFLRSRLRRERVLVVFLNGRGAQHAMLREYETTEPNSNLRRQSLTKTRREPTR